MGVRVGQVSIPGFGQKPPVTYRSNISLHDQLDGYPCEVATRTAVTNTAIVIQYPKTIRDLRALQNTVPVASPLGS